jgi:hypothetical protein
MSKLPKEVLDLIRDSESVKVLATTDEEGNPHIAFKESLTVLDNGKLAFGEEFEGSQTNVNMVRSIWFNGNVELTVRDGHGTTFQIQGKPYRYVHAGPLFKKFYLAERERRGPDSELAGVWIITPEDVKNETYEVRKKEEDEKHPFFRHFDRESVRKIK